VWLEAEVITKSWYGQFEPWQQDKDPAGSECESQGKKQDFCFSIWVSQAMRNLEFMFQKKIDFKNLKLNQYMYNQDLLDRTKARNYKYRFGRKDGEDIAGWDKVQGGNPYDVDETDPNFVVPMTHYAGAPMYLSLPVLGLVDDEERDRFTGLEDFDFDKHAPYLAVEPVTGKGVLLRKRFQYNLKLEKRVLSSKAWAGIFKSVGFEENSPTASVVWPMIWVTDGNEINDDDAEDLEFYIYTMGDIMDGAKWQGPLVGVIFLAFAAWLIYFACTGRGCCCKCESQNDTQKLQTTLTPPKTTPSSV